MAGRSFGSHCACNQEEATCECFGLVCQNITNSLKLGQEYLILGEEDFWSHPQSGLLNRFESFDHLVKVCARIFQFTDAVKEVLISKQPKLPLRLRNKVNFQRPRPSNLTKEDLNRSRKFLLIKLSLRN